MKSSISYGRIKIHNRKGEAIYHTPKLFTPDGKVYPVGRDITEKQAKEILRKKGVKGIKKQRFNFHLSAEFDKKIGKDMKYKTR